MLFGAIQDFKSWGNYTMERYVWRKWLKYKIGIHKKEYNPLLFIYITSAISKYIKSHNVEYEKHLTISQEVVTKSEGNEKKYLTYYFEIPIGKWIKLDVAKSKLYIYPIIQDNKRNDIMIMGYEIWYKDRIVYNLFMREMINEIEKTCADTNHGKENIKTVYPINDDSDNESVEGSVISELPHIPLFIHSPPPRISNINWLQLIRGGTVITNNSRRENIEKYEILDKQWLCLKNYKEIDGVNNYTAKKSQMEKYIKLSMKKSIKLSKRLFKQKDFYIKRHFEITQGQAPSQIQLQRPILVWGDNTYDYRPYYTTHLLYHHRTVKDLTEQIYIMNEIYNDIKEKRLIELEVDREKSIKNRAKRVKELKDLFMSRKSNEE